MVPLARMSSASPARRSSPITDPSFSRKDRDLDLGLADLDRQGNVDIFQKPHIFGANTLGGGGIISGSATSAWSDIVRSSRRTPLFQAGLQIDRSIHADLAKFTEEGIFTADLYFDALTNRNREGIADLHVDQLVHRHDGLA